MLDRRFDLVLEQQRSLVLLAASIGSLAALTNILLIYTVPRATAVDLATQVVVTLGIVALAAWILIDTERTVRRPTAVVATLVAVGLSGRLLYSLLGPGLDGNPDDAIAPVMAWMPFGFVMAFSFLERDLAIRVSIGFLLLTTPPVALYAAFHHDVLPHSPRLAELTHQFLFAHPLYVVFLSIISQVHHEFRGVNQQAQVDDLGAASHRHIDLATLLPNRSGYRQRLGEFMTQARDSGAPLSVGLIQISGLEFGEGDMQAEADSHRAIAQLMQQQLAGDTLLGRLGDDRFGVAWPAAGLTELVAQTESLLAELEVLLGEIAQPAPQCRAGLAAYRPGESLDMLLTRCDEQLRRIDCDPGSRWAYDTLDAC